MIRTFLICCIGLGVLGSFVNAESIATYTKTPVRLNASQMDNITARGSYLSANAYAWGVGDNTLATTSTNLTFSAGRAFEKGDAQASATSYGDLAGDAVVYFVGATDGNIQGEITVVKKNSEVTQTGYLTTAEGIATFVAGDIADGNTAFADASADAYGLDSLTETGAYTVTGYLESGAESMSSSANQ